jgi:predicted SAM-dependent methyltransferase
MPSLRLNLGCAKNWKRTDPDWVNIDADPAAEPDVLADAAALPYDDATVDEIYAGHLLEHLPESLSLAPLREWHRVLRPGGTLTVVVPDLLAAARVIRADQLNPQGVTLSMAILGSEDTPWQHHRRTYNEARLLTELAAVFGSATLLGTLGIDWQVAAQATKDGC